jgi:hypothetical protein
MVLSGGAVGSEGFAILLFAVVEEMVLSGGTVGSEGFAILWFVVGGSDGTISCGAVGGLDATIWCGATGGLEATIGVMMLECSGVMVSGAICAAGTVVGAFFFSGQSRWVVRKCELLPHLQIFLLLLIGSSACDSFCFLFVSVLTIPAIKPTPGP